MPILQVCRMGKHSMKERKFSYLLVLPAAALISIFTIYPLLYAVRTSLYDIVLTMPFIRPYVGAGNYRDVLGSYYFRGSLFNTLVYAGISVCLVTLIGLGVSFLLNAPFKLSGALRVLILFPWAIPFVVSGVIWKWIFNSSYGVFNGLLYTLGIIDSYVSWLSHPFYAKLCLVTAHVWKEMPFASILFLAGLQAVPRELFDACKVDGGTSWSIFRYVIFPLLRPVLLVIVIYETMIGITTFDLVYVMTGGGPGDSTSLLSWYAYAETFKFLNLGKGAALSIILALLILAIIIGYIRVIRLEEVY